jgi:hypothetical protein
MEATATWFSRRVRRLARRSSDQASGSDPLQLTQMLRRAATPYWFDLCFLLRCCGIDPEKTIVAGQRRSDSADQLLVLPPTGQAAVISYSPAGGNDAALNAWMPLDDLAPAERDLHLERIRLAAAMVDEPG